MHLPFNQVVTVCYGGWLCAEEESEEESEDEEAPQGVPMGKVRG